MGERTRRSLVVAGVVAACAAVAAVLVGPAGTRARRSFATSSSPGASLYEWLAGPLLGWYYDRIARDVAEVLDGMPAASILEVGPGPGHLAERILGRLPGARLTMLDIDPAMLAATARRTRVSGIGDRATVVEGDVASLPFVDGSFDCVVSSLSAHHWPDAGAGFREIKRVLAPHGTALVYDLPATWAHAETGSRGIAAASDAFAAPAARRAAGVGPWTVITRLVLRPDDDGVQV